MTDAPQSDQDRIHVQLIGNIFDGNIRITIDGTDDEPEDAHEIAAMFNNNPERLAVLAANPSGIVLVPKANDHA